MEEPPGSSSMHQQITESSQHMYRNIQIISDDKQTLFKHGLPTAHDVTIRENFARNSIKHDKR